MGKIKKRDEKGVQKKIAHWTGNLPPKFMHSSFLLFSAKRGVKMLSIFTYT